MAGDGGQLASKVILNTALAASAGGVVALMLWKLQTGIHDFTVMCNGVLGGLVSITAPCGCVDSWAAIVIGIVAAFVLIYSIKLTLWLEIDDPVNAINVHGFCGLWGLVSAGLFATPEYGTGLFFGSTNQFVAQLVAIAILPLWSIVWSFIFWLVLDATLGIRVSLQQELYSLDDGVDLPELAALQSFMKDAAHLRELLSNPNGPKEQKKLQTFHVFLLKSVTHSRTPCVSLTCS
jgi:Amt family ammonium transporter